MPSVAWHQRLQQLDNALADLSAKIPTLERELAELRANGPIVEAEFYEAVDGLFTKTEEA